MTKHDPLCWRSKTPVSDLGGPCVCDVIRQARADEKAKADLATSMWEQEVARLRAELDEALERAACWREKYIIEDVLENVTPEEVVRATDKARATLAERNRIRDRINSRYERVHAEHGGGVGYWEGYLDALGTVVSRDVEED